MAKSTRGGKFSTVNNNQTSENTRANKLIERTAFTNEGGGNYQLDIEGVGGAQVLDERDSRRAKFGSGPAYGITVWDKDYNIIGQADTIYFGTLNEAKREAKKRLKTRYSK